MSRPLVLVLVLTAVATASAETFTPEQRAALLRRAEVWERTDVRARNLRVGPRGPGDFDPGETVTCEYDGQDFEGNSPKFKCKFASGDAMKVKFGARNGEVQGEVAASRLLWALGFGADRMYPVRVVCRGCPATIGVPAARAGEQLVDPAAIERPVSAGDVPDELKAWSWTELDAVTADNDASRAHRDALKLLAVFMQHTDSKPEQQRLVCRDGTGLDAGTCQRPFLMLNDVGLTFGRAHFTNSNAIGSVNLREWLAMPVWKNPDGCVANLPKSFTGTLRDPLISEDGRAFLAGLLVQLSDRQIRDLFESAGMDRRHPDGGVANSVDSWVEAFIRKRDEIVNRRCLPEWSSEASVAFDTDAIRWLQSGSSPPLTGAMNAISLLGYTRVFIALAVIVAFINHLRLGASLLLLVALTGVMTDAAKVTAGLPRPTAVDSRVSMLVDAPFADANAEASTLPSVDDDDVYGFPSGHIAVTTAFMLGLMILGGWRGAGFAALIIVPLMAASRLYLGRHFPADIVGGVAIAVVATALVARLRLWRLDDRPRGRRTGLRVAAYGALIVAVCAIFGIPPAYEAGRLAGFAAAIAVLGWTGAFALSKPAEGVDARGIRRIAIAAGLFGVAWWVIDTRLTAAGVSASIAGQVALGGVPAFLLLPGPLWLERLVDDRKHRLDHLINRHVRRIDVHRIGGKRKRRRRAGLV